MNFTAENVGGVAMPDSGDYCKAFEPDPGPLKRLSRKLYPSRHCDMPGHLPEFKDVFVCNVTVSLSFTDRIRVLFSGKLRVDSKTATENELGRHVTNSIAYPVL